VPTWDSDRPKGNRPANEVDDTVSENFESLEDALQAHSEFPGVDGTSRGRFKLPHVTVAAADALSDLADGHIALIKNLGGTSQADGDAESTHFWPARYSAEGGTGQLNAFVRMALPVADDAADETAIGGELGANDLGFPLYRKHASGLYVPKLWDGSAFVQPYAIARYGYDRKTRATVGAGLFTNSTWTSWIAASAGVITLVVPLTGNWRVCARAVVYVIGDDEDEGIGIRLRDGTAAATLQVASTFINQDANSDSFQVLTPLVIDYSANATNGATLTLDIEGATSTGSAAASVNATQTLGGTSVTTTSTLEAWLELRP
jgi:hypothetical protein